MNQIITTWAGLDSRKQGVIFLAALAIIVSIFSMFKLATTPSLTLLYAGLETRAAGDVVSALEQRRAIYEVRGGSIYVEAGLRDELRMTLASEGLPANGSSGYELLDSLSGFGTTSQMFDAAYWRAKEGELARTIVASPHVVQARVHIAQSSSNPFSRAIEPSASVSIIPSGTSVTPAQANALRYLIASAVAGLSVSNVTIIDTNGILIESLENNTSLTSAVEQAQILRDRVLRIIEARVGPGNVVVEVSVETVTETETIRQRTFDPESRVAISIDTEERIDKSTNQNDSVTVASNIPDGAVNEPDGTSSEISETRERINYEVSETEHEILRTPGDIKRLTIAVLVNGLISGSPENTEKFEPRSEVEMLALRDLVASAIGFDASRGDVITLKTMDLLPRFPIGTPAVVSLLGRLNFDVMSLIRTGILALVVLVLGLFVVRPLMSKQGRDGVLAVPSSLTPGVVSALTGEITVPVAQLNSDDRNSSDLITFPKLESPNDPVERLRTMIGERQEETVEILRGWLEENEEIT